ncbi:MAG: hypothetical protein M3130_11020 [Actinomycetota bacterium]|nr:hypothetical protein [Actinomycetota bacterium]
MGIFASLTRKDAAAGSEHAADLSERVRSRLPARFEAVGEALASGRDAGVACALVGRELARDGADLGEALLALRSTCAQVLDQDPDFETIHALSVAWGEETLGYLHQLSCEDPLTGLATLAHVRARLSEIYRGTEQAGAAVSSAYALVVIDLGGTSPGSTEHVFGEALRLARFTGLARVVFPGSETIGALRRTRLVVVTARTVRLGGLVAALRMLIVQAEPDARVRVWIEGLPTRIGAAAALLDELSRV